MKVRDAPRATRAALSRWLPPRRVAKLLAAAVTAAILVGAGSIAWIRLTTRNLQYDVATAPPADIAIVFGAQVYRTGKPSPYLAARLDLGRRLLAAGKVKAILVSGDNGAASHHESEAMRAYLVERGVPAAKIALDGAGFTTYDSCVRAHDVFGVRSAIAVTQDFSVPRTLALCRAAGIDAVAVADTARTHDDVYRKCWLRDQLAATKAVYSILFRPEPRSSGQPETTVRDAMAAP
ncbi:vancomycin high temperature exclusion protein [Nocardia sp. NPDC058058]|uniref:SanA/YdcF family protein n=1 Tax=Nocardia sp. NPDC058058 TaxID=3346317 RepID=UPI0036D9350E